MKRQATLQSDSEVDRASARISFGSLSLRQINRWLIGLLVFYALAMANCCNFFLLDGWQLQTTSATLNRCLSGAILLLPVGVLLAHLATSSNYRWWIVTPLSLLTIPSTLLACFSFVMELPKPLQLLREGNTIVRCFRVPEFDFYVVDIERQWMVMPGVVWSVPVHREQKAQGVTATLRDEHHLRCTFIRDKHFADEFTVRENEITVLIH